jgi:hypothetical protein
MDGRNSTVDPIKIIYSFKFQNGLIKEFPIVLDRETLRFITEDIPTPPVWAELNYDKCSVCTLDEVQNRHCPIALNLLNINEEFKDSYSYEDVSVSVITDERRYAKDTSLQDGLSALLGIIMVTSGCPVMEYLKPMARFHLPFATLIETVFRMSSMYFMAQFFLGLNGGKPFDMSLEGMKKIFTNVTQVNKDFSQRLADAASKDAHINALVNLDCFATIIASQAEDTLKEIENYFSAYFK